MAEIPEVVESLFLDQCQQFVIVNFRELIGRSSAVTKFTETGAMREAPRLLFRFVDTVNVYFDNHFREEDGLITMTLSLFMKETATTTLFISLSASPIACLADDWSIAVVNETRISGFLPTFSYLIPSEVPSTATERYVSGTSFWLGSSGVSISLVQAIMKKNRVEYVINLIINKW